MSTPTAETRIQQARDIALDILNPTQQQLDHGLELHRESIVIETYGLGFRAPLDTNAITTAIDAGASPLELQDLSEDMRMTRWAQDPALRTEYRAAWAADRGTEDVPLLCAVAKAYAGDAGRFVCGEAIQLHGGVGFTWEYDPHIYFKRVKTLEQFYGSTRSQLEAALRAAGI